MPAPLTAAIPVALDLSGGYTMRFTAVDPTTGATVSGVNVSGVTVEGEAATADEAQPAQPAGQIFLVPGPALAT